MATDLILMSLVKWRCKNLKYLPSFTGKWQPDRQISINIQILLLISATRLLFIFAWLLVFGAFLEFGFCNLTFLQLHHSIN